MKIAHVTLYPPKGAKHVSSSGVASYSKNLIAQLAEDGDEHVVICDRGTEGDEYVEDGITICRSFTRSPRFVLQVHKTLRQERPDVVHIQQELALYGNVLTAYLLQWLVFAWRKRAVVTLHGVVDPAKVDAAFVQENNSKLPVWLVRLAFRVIYSPLMRWPRTVIVHERQFKDIMVRSYGVRPERIAVIPHGVETFPATGKAAARQAAGLPQQAKIVLFMGYATGYKGLDLLIEGFSEFAQGDKDAFLVIGAGRHPKLRDDPAYQNEYARLQRKARARIPAAQYAWQGFISENDISTYYGAADVSIYPYTTVMSSSGPMSFAIGHEKPFLVSTAFKEVFTDHPQLLFGRDAAGLSDRLAYFFAHQKQFAAISQQLKTERTWQRVAQRTRLAYQDVFNRKGAYEAEESITTG